ncbi:hypothetical protein [Paracoccus aerius]|uniref:Uncharacterized protein n=1 Tax=Paracoccus aerius TaxID=1915382 RepID=A0ABS1S115_9RHOB|nr:hypothetical protein [Paracoccus aerius]MBL3672254.1 hypothetical protein [Paracoccus aerius]GHG11328.1 hypothetical protein GCM10017322_03540 [Paracoccus aerius]
MDYLGAILFFVGIAATGVYLLRAIFIHNRSRKLSRAGISFGLALVGFIIVGTSDKPTEPTASTTAASKIDGSKPPPTEVAAETSQSENGEEYLITLQQFMDLSQDDRLGPVDIHGSHAI